MSEGEQNGSLVKPTTDMTGHAGPLPSESLYRAADLSALPFATTDDLEPLRALAAQDRAHEAIRLGTSIATRGFNIFAIGLGDGCMGEPIQAVLTEAAARRSAPNDWVYVHNFSAPHHPLAIALPPGRAPPLDAAATELLDDLRVALPAVFESEDYQRRRGAIDASSHGPAERAFKALGTRATAQGVPILRRPMGFAVAPAAPDPQAMRRRCYGSMRQSRHT